MARKLNIVVNPDKEELRKHLKRTALMACQGCGKRPAGAAGVFIPNEPWLYVANKPRANAQRAIVYAICEKCIKNDVPTQLEEKWATEGDDR